MSSWFEKHAATLDKALDACARRYSWTAYPESPSSRVHGTELPARGRREFEALLGDDSALACAHFGVTADGNWEHRNVLHLPQGLAPAAAAAASTFRNSRRFMRAGGRMAGQERAKRASACTSSGNISFASLNTMRPSRSTT